MEWFLQQGWHNHIQWSALLLTITATWLWGAAPERLAGISIAGMLLFESGYHRVSPGGMSIENLDALLAIDLLATVAITWIAIRANRIYTLLLAALQMVSVLAHVARLIGPEVEPGVYALLAIGPTYPAIAVLAWGTWRHHRRVSRYGEYPSWTMAPPRVR